MGDELKALPSDLSFRRHWWWDPVPIDLFNRFDPKLQHEVLAAAIDAQSRILKTHAEGLDKIAGTIRGAAK